MAPTARTIVEAPNRCYAADANRWKPTRKDTIEFLLAAGADRTPSTRAAYATARRCGHRVVGSSRASLAAPPRDRETERVDTAILRFRHWTRRRRIGTTLERAGQISRCCRRRGRRDEKDGKGSLSWTPRRAERIRMFWPTPDVGAGLCRPAANQVSAFALCASAKSRRSSAISGRGRRKKLTYSTRGEKPYEDQPGGGFSLVHTSWSRRKSRRSLNGQQVKVVKPKATSSGIITTSKTTFLVAAASFAWILRRYKGHPPGGFHRRSL